MIPRPVFAAEIQNLTVVSYPARPAKLPLWLAQDAGLFEKNGLKVSVKELNSSEELIQSIQRREGQIYAATANWLVSGIGDGFDRFSLPTPVIAFQTWLDRILLVRKSQRKSRYRRAEQ
jgi:ABC-type nitrate/sulfonate/bicarbonate transport system substrate-binding protein